MDADSNPQFSVREVQPGDAPAIRALFAHVFQKEMSQALWDWKYKRPLSAAVGIWRGDECVAHYGGMGFDISFMGTAAVAADICDVMVSPSVRQGVRTQSPFFLMSKFAQESFVRPGGRWKFGYGFPTDRHMALAARLKVYAAVGRIWELSWDLAAPIKVPLLLKVRKLDAANIEPFRGQVDALGVQQRSDLSERITVRKDAAWVEWRFLRHPHEKYEVLLVTHRLTGKPVGLCVLKVEPERVLWMEALGPLAHLPALAQVARAAALRLDRSKLVLWCSAPDIERFGNVTTAQALPITTPVNVWVQGPDPADLQDRWWLLASDTDYL